MSPPRRRGTSMSAAGTSDRVAEEEHPLPSSGNHGSPRTDDVGRTIWTSSRISDRWKRCLKKGPWRSACRGPTSARKWDLAGSIELPTGTGNPEAMSRAAWFSPGAESRSAHRRRMGTEIRGVEASMAFDSIDGGSRANDRQSDTTRSGRQAGEGDRSGRPFVCRTTHRDKRHA